MEARTLKLRLTARDEMNREETATGGGEALRMRRTSKLKPILETFVSSFFDECQKKRAKL